MSEGGSLINLGELSKPATVLIERISDAVGALFRPRQLRRVARAEADAARIRALADIEITELEHRALLRMVAEEGKRQENMERIASLAIEDLTADAAPQNVERDWLTHFFDKCRGVSDAEMQTLWGRILAGESNSPGSFSRRTVEYVATLDKRDANAFTALCRFGWLVGNVVPIIFEVDNEIYAKGGVNFAVLKHLDDIGLVTFNNVTGFIRTRLPKRIAVSYYGTLIVVEFGPEGGNQLPLGKVLLTQVGQELATICGSTRSDDFLNFAVSEWAKQDLALYSPWPKQVEGTAS